MSALALIIPCPSSFSSAPEPQQDSPGSCPIFVVGALRSGTTLFRLMLDSHQDIANPGEADFIFDYLERDPETNKWTYDVDRLQIDRVFRSYGLEIPMLKDGIDFVLHFVWQFRQRTNGHLTLNVLRNIDKIVAVLPDAKIIHLVRDPRDVAKSCVAMGWAGNAYFGVDQWLEVEHGWDRSASKFKRQNVKELHYEDLVLNTQAELEDVCRFIGVPFSSGMLNYPAHSTYGAPDVSSVQQWKKNLTARDVELVEIKTRPLLLARSYELGGRRHDPPSLLERLCLFGANKIYKWRFGCRRYGAYNFFMEKVTRRLVKSFHSIFAQRMNVIANQHLR